jgi:predicted AlkP superfamily pyrophosphatase or phosphodiesterase
VAAKKLVLIVVDGMTPAAFERAVEGRRAPALALLAAHGTYRRATSVFPSLTPVCLSSIATGAGPDVHRIPHLVWWHRDERRVVEYGSSFAALRAAGMAQSITDTIFNMNQRHLGADAVTVYEALEDAGLVTAAVNITCYRGRNAHLPTLPWVTKPAYGPKRFFYYSLFESDPTGAPLAVRNRAGGSIDAYASAVGRWLVTRDGFDFLAYYLSDFDYASHAHGPLGAEDVALARTDAAVQALLDAAGGVDVFLERYAVIVHSDHGQSTVERAAQLERTLDPHADHVVVTASNRAGQVYLLPDARVDAGTVARSLDRDEAVELTLRREDDEAVARREGEELRFRPADGGWETSGDASILDHPDARARAWSALANPNAGEVLVSAAPGWEFADLGGRHHAGGGSHGSLIEDDSVVPVLTIGIDAEPARITDVMPAALAHFGVEAPAYLRAGARVV